MLFGVIAIELTGNSVYDAVAGMLIGVLLMGLALLINVGEQAAAHR